MARPLPILGGILLSFSPPAEATAQYSIIPEPSRTELRQETAKTLQLLSDQEVPTLGTDAYRLTVTPQGAHLASGGREGRIYGLATLRQLPVPGYPKLKSVASRREESFGDGIPHEGMYTKQELKELVAYCAALGIEVIPEIDMPGHNQALHAAYPEFFCFPKPDMNVRTTAGNSKELVCPQKPEVWKFYASVFNELKDIFPSGIVHLGGDEAPTELWEKCPLCQEARTRAAMKDEQEQMKAFFAKTAALLAKNGQTPQFWYEGNAGIYHPGETVYAWRQGQALQSIEKTKKAGLNLIMASSEYCYLDFPQIQGQRNWGWMKTTTLQKCYDLDPAFGKPEKEAGHIRGVHAPVWAERLPDLNHLLYRAYPRACAIAEAGWSPMGVRSWENFRRKLADHRQFILKRFNYDMERTQGNEPAFRWENNK